MSGGWGAKYQGLQLRSVSFQRSLGLEPDGTVVTALVKKLPTLAPSGTKGLFPPGRGGVKGERLKTSVRNPKPTAVRQPESVARVGDLLLEEELNGKKWVVTVKDLFVSSIKKDSADRHEGEVTIALTDARAFWDRGHLEIWTFNVAAVEGGPVADSVNPKTKKPWTLAEIAEYAVSRFPGAPKLTRAPARWKEWKPQFRFSRFSQAKAALQEILDRYPARVSLHLDGSVGIYEPGDSSAPPPEKFVRERLDEGNSPNRDKYPDFKIRGFAYGGGGSNSTQIPLKHLRTAQDNSRGQASGYPPLEALVVGGERHATVAVDYWEPVLDIRGEIYPLSEGVALLFRGQELLRSQEELSSIRSQLNRTDLGLPEREQFERQAKSIEKRLDVFFASGKGKATSDEMLWLSRWVLRPEEFRIFGGKQARRDLGFAFEVLSRDAWKLWRLPGAETYNRHLLPIQNRAESAGGVRAPVLIETYSFRQKSTPVAAAPGGAITTTGNELVPDKLLAAYHFAQARIAALRAAIDQQLLIKNNPSLAVKGFALLSPAGIRAAVEDQLRARPGEGFLDYLARTGADGIDKIAAPLNFPGLSKPLKTLSPEVARAVADKKGSFSAGIQAVFARVKRNPQLVKEVEQYSGAGELVSEFGRRGLQRYFPVLITEQAGLKELAGEYKGALAAEASAAKPLDQSFSYTADLEFELGELLVKAGDKIKGRVPADQVKEVRVAVELIDKIADRIRRQRQSMAAKYEGILKNVREGLSEPDYPMARYYANLPRTPANNAVVDDADRGLVRTREVAGHLRRTDVESLRETSLIPRPVRVAWGVWLQPSRTDQPKSPLVYRRPRPIVGKAPTGKPGKIVTAPNDPAYAKEYCTSAGLFESDVEAHGNLSSAAFDTAQGAKDLRVSYYRSAWRRASPGVVTKLGIPDVEGAKVIDDPSLVELIGLAGGSNVGELDRKAEEAARAATRQLDVLDSAERVYRRPWPVDCDGLVSGVEISTADGLMGLRTRVVVGVEQAPFVDWNKTYVRPPRRRQPDQRQRPDEA